jgi:TonB family protein
MKLFFLILLFIIPFGCKEDEKIEIIQADQVYFASNELEVLPEIIVKEADGKLIYRITTEVKELYDSLDQNEKESFKLDYRLLVNENGKVDKIQVIKSKYPQFDKIMAEAVVNLQFSPAIKDGKKVKFIFPWGYNNEMLSTLNLNIPQQDSDQNIYFVAVEEMPGPIGGMYAIQSRIKYPENAKNQGIEGKVFIQAFIDETGNVIKANVIKGAGYGLDEAALSAVKQTKFTPGKQKGKPVKVQVTIPIVFKLQ